MAQCCSDDPGTGTYRGQWSYGEIPLQMADFLSELGQPFLTTEQRTAAASALAWLPFPTINAEHSSGEVLREEKELLKARIQQLENEITSTTGQAASPFKGISPLKLRPIALEGEKDLHQQDPWILGVPKKAEQTKSQLEDLQTSDPLERRPGMTQKTRKFQDRPPALAPGEWPPALATLHVAQLMDLSEQLKQRPRDSIAAWLLR